LKNGRIRVDSMKATAGTIAFSQGIGTFMMEKYAPIAR